MEQRTKIEISSWTILKVLFVIAFVFLLFLVKDIVALFFIVLILTATFSPTIRNWEKYLGRTLSIVLLFLAVFASLGLVVYLFIPPLVNQTSLLAADIPQYVSNMNFDFLKPYIPQIRNSLLNLSSDLGAISTNIFTFTAGVFQIVFAIIMLFVLTFYMLLDERKIKEFISSLFSSQDRENGVNIIKKIAEKVGSWFRGQMLLCLIIFTIDLIGYSILGVPFALILAIIAGLLEIVPTVGPLVSGVIVALVALTISPWKALFVIIFCLLVSLFENVVVVPKVMQKAVGISPVIILLALLIGAKLMGVVGAVLSVPVAASLSVVIFEWPTISKMFSKE